MTRPLTSIIILNHNTWAECTQFCVQHAQQHTTPPFEIILVDNGSAPDEVAQIEMAAREMSSVRLVATGENLGFAAGHNYGLTQVRPDARWLCLLNSDCWIQEADWNRKAARLFEAQPQLGALSLTQGEKCHFLDGEFGDAYWFEPEQEPYDCEWINGACLLVDRSRVGEPRFDTYYSPAYWEDADLSFAIRQQGWAVAQRPDFDVVHLGSRTVARMPKGIPFQGERLTVEYLYARNRMYLLRKWQAMLHPRLDEEHSRQFIRQFYHRQAAAAG